MAMVPREEHVTTIGISIDVEDVDRAVHFYRDGLGLRLVDKGDGWATMALGAQIFFLGLPWGPEGGSSETISDIGHPCISTSWWTTSTPSLSKQ
jgi:catechol 2,3-dioxygenase-like lactoylglutathione lyase family enzyme